jgi:2-methylcitrate dehydratase PrpD
VAEEINAPASAVLDALLIGAEASIRIGMVLGRRHYDRGFHQTATAGAFGATVAAARVMGLARDETRNALSLVATRASGLKSQFGSMGKPFNAGVAASNGSLPVTASAPTETLRRWTRKPQPSIEARISNARSISALIAALAEAASPRRSASAASR